MRLNRHKIIIFFLLSSYLFLQGCATLFQKPKTSAALHYLSWNERQKQLRKINQWDLDGSLSINYQGRNDIVNFAWQQKYADYTIEFHGPLHLGGAKIVGNDSKVDLIRGANDIIEANSPEEILLSQFGWSLPISDMIYWVKAIPSPNAAIQSSSFDQYHHLILLRQQGWQMRYADFKSINSIDLPTKIYLESQGVMVKLVLRWSK